MLSFLYFNTVYHLFIASSLSYQIGALVATNLILVIQKKYIKVTKRQAYCLPQTVDKVPGYAGAFLL